MTTRQWVPSVSLPDLRPGDKRISDSSAVTRMSEMLLRHKPVVDEIQARIDRQSGPKCQVSVHAFLAIGWALGMTGKDMLMSDMAGLARSLGAGQHGALGLRRPGDAELTYRQFEHVATKNRQPRVRRTGRPRPLVRP